MLGFNSDSSGFSDRRNYATATITNASVVASNIINDARLGTISDVSSRIIVTSSFSVRLLFHCELLITFIFIAHYLAR